MAVIGGAGETDRGSGPHVPRKRAIIPVVDDAFDNARVTPQGCQRLGGGTLIGKAQGGGAAFRYDARLRGQLA